MKKIVLISAMLVILFSCRNNRIKEEELAPDLKNKPPVNFMMEIKPIIAQHCLECHSASSPNPITPYWDDLPSLHEYATKPSSIDHRYSIIQARLKGIEQPGMPFFKPRLADSLISKIDIWVSQGAQTN